MASSRQAAHWRYVRNTIPAQRSEQLDQQELRILVPRSQAGEAGALLADLHSQSAERLISLAMPRTRRRTVTEPRWPSFTVGRP